MNCRNDQTFKIYLEHELVRRAVIQVATDSCDRVIKSLCIIHLQALGRRHHLSELAEINGAETRKQTMNGVQGKRRTVEIQQAPCDNTATIIQQK